MAAGRNPALPIRNPSFQGWTDDQLHRNFSRLGRRLDTAISKAPYIVGVATGTTGTGASTGEVELLEVTFPSGFMGTTGALRISAGLSLSGSAGNVTVRLRFGDGTGGAGDGVVGSITLAALAAAMTITAYVINLNDAASQRCYFQVVVSGGATATTTTLAIDTGATPSGQATGAALHVTLTGQTADAADEVTGHLLMVESLPRQAI